MIINLQVSRAKAAYRYQAEETSGAAVASEWPARSHLTAQATSSHQCASQVVLHPSHVSLAPSLFPLSSYLQGFLSHKLPFLSLPPSASLNAISSFIQSFDLISTVPSISPTDMAF